jgi:DNA-binding GntR family transcriptional regulator
LTITLTIKYLRDVTTKDRRPLSGAAGRNLVEAGLRSDIQRGQIVPGQRLVEADLAERYAVTRGSARAALDVLIADGLVERIRNRGGRVRTLSTDEAIEVLECRMVLDGLLARKAVEHGTDDDVARLHENLAAMDEAVGSGDLLKYSDLIQEHHALVRAAARHATASNTVERLQAQIVRHQFRLSLRPARAAESLEELRGVVREIEARRPGAAETATQAHLRGVIEAVIAESHEG